MSWVPFKTQVSGKWVLAGEHSVSRGATAIALPNRDFHLSLEFTPGPQGELDERVRDLLRSMDDAWKEEGLTFPFPQGRLELRNTIPTGAGLGFSAALSVALVRWVSGPLGIAPGRRMELAMQLEHRLHGQSGGMEVEVLLAGEPISFVQGRGATPLGIRRLPRFTFHDSGMRNRASECRVRVELMREESPTRAMRIDELMGAAARSAMEGLIRYDAGDAASGLRLVAEGMKTAQECFYSWELVPGKARELEQSLLEQGALAAKLTGAGGGGFLVALWPNQI